MARPPERPENTEHAIRLLRPRHGHFKNGRVKPEAFKTKTVSFFMMERLPDATGDCLHREAYETCGRARLQAEHVRATEFIDGEEETVRPFDLDLTPDDVAPPFEDLKNAHADLRGPLHDIAAIVALTKQFNALGFIDKEPAAG